MNNLTTRKIVLGLLMVLVLAFSVQGTAEALKFNTTTRTGDLQTVLPGDFTITFSATPDADSVLIRNGEIYDDQSDAPTAPGSSVGLDSAGYHIDNNGNKLNSEGQAIDSQGYHLDENGDREDLNNDGNNDRADVGERSFVKVSDKYRYYRNEERVQIAAGTDGSGTVTIKKVGNYDITPSATIEMSELEGTRTGTTGSFISNSPKLSRSHTLTLSASAAGEVTVTITDQTPATTDSDSTAAPYTSTTATYEFTVYVVNFDSAITAAAFAFTDGAEVDSTTQAVARSDQRDQSIGFNVTGSTPSTHIPLEFKVEGGGQVYVYATSTRTGRPSSTLSTSSAATVYLDMRDNTNKVTAWVSGTNPAVTGKSIIYIHGYAQLEITEGDGQTGAPGGRLEGPLGVKVTDSRNRPIRYPLIVTFPSNSPNSENPGTFIPFPGTTLLDDSEQTVATSTDPAAAATHDVYTDSRSIAKIYYQLDSGIPASAGNSYNITPNLKHNMGVTTRFTFRVGTTGSERVANLEIVSGNPQSAAKGKDLTTPLVVIARSTAGYRIPDVVIQFRSGIGILSRHGLTEAPTVNRAAPLEWGEIPENTPNPSSGQQIYVKTGSDGQASVTYNVGQFVIAREVTAEIRHEPIDSDYSFAIDRVVFNVNGRAGTGGGTAPPPPTTTRTITIVPSSIDGEPGEEIDISISSSPSTVVILESGELDDADFSRLFGTTPFDVTIELPDEEDDYTFSATAPGFTTATATVTVEEEEVEEGTLSIVAVGAPSGGQQTIRITVRDSAGVLAVGAVSVTLTGTGVNRIVPTANGSGAAVIPVPNTVSVQAEGYRLATLTLTGTGQVDDTADDPVPPPAADTGGEPDSISIVGPAARSGTVNEGLEAALIVRVLDDDDNGIEDARVFYRVIEGRGRISDGSRGGRRIGVVTDDDGYARVNFTPTDGGTHTIRVNTDDLSATVEFTITTGSGSGARDAGTGGTPGASISPVVHVAAASRPPMLWVDGGAIYALVGADVKEFAPSVDNALNIAIGGGKVYWTEKTGESGGTINSANLNGSDVTELASIFATPMGIAVDVTNSKLYWTNSSGRIQSANLDGSRITNELQNLASPMDIALAGGNAYWTQGGNVRFVNLRGQKVVRNVSTGMDTAGSLAIGGGKVYWTEMTGESGGTVNSANLNGTGATQLASILAVPVGIAVDTARSKLYWTNARGRVQSANLDGSKITNVVSGLGSPGELVLSNSIATPTATPTTPTTPTTASNKYDVNGDGSVDNTDSDAVTVAIAAGATDAKYDVNGDGKVNVFDLVEIIANRDPGAAGAPTLFGMKMSAVQIDHLQEQIDLLIATNDRSPAAMRVLVYLQQLLVTARPEKTQLLANYPNPFNPETWIPYELATDTHVRITIYNTQGVEIRSLEFGHQSAGYYVGRDRAAYWDGRNALGEQVASGLYFYQLETDEMSSMRKMVILK